MEGSWLSIISEQYGMGIKPIDDSWLLYYFRTIWNWY